MTDPKARPRMKLEELLLRHGAIDEAQLKKAREEQKSFGGELGRVLVAMGAISEDLLLRALAHQLQLPFVDFNVGEVDFEAIKKVPIQVCERFGVMPVAFDEAKRTLKIATALPDDAEHLRALAAAVQPLKFEPLIAPAKEIEKAVRRYYFGETTGKFKVQPMYQTDSVKLQMQQEARAAQTSAPPPPPASSMAEAVGSARVDVAAELASIAERLAAVEAQLVSNPLFAALTARLERLEQLGATELQFIKMLGEIVVEKGLISRDEYLQRAQKARSG